MSQIPTFEQFERQLGQPWTLRWDEGEGLAITLVEVAEGTAMNARYQCYDAVFAQPPGVQMPQHVYRLCSPEGDEWDVMLTPIGPDQEGDCHLLQALFHVKRPKPVGTHP
ncbi:DUF6916 family protein [Metapseudomonas resinovorans]|uniref:DUF6916 domain-containing protein n=1 Tax=Metapseudomonas resinovorans NBRC 106553 TaxID=1245471 RepID=S6BEB6_METRE|nr:hypothetical protein [Pseudomonas resinovorans]BAN47409.1 hypothetical protein PCA10_16770 [Pseudomonas resinovorans NBRC 106553]